MKKVLLVALLITVLVGGLVLLDGMTFADKKKVTAKKGEFLRTQDIQGTLDTDISFLAEIGLKIDNAREKSDAIDLSACALLMYYAEKISGKTSNIITGKKLLEESSKLAETQKNVKALNAVSKIWADNVNGPGDAKMADKYSEMAKLMAEEQKDKTRAYSETGSVLVKNNTAWDIHIYIDGYYQGVQYEWQDKTYYSVPAGP